MKRGFHHFSTINIDEDTLERIRISVPVIFKGNKIKKTNRKKEDEKMFRNGYHREFSGGMEIWKKGTI